jgi:O-antigen ligase
VTRSSIPLTPSEHAVDSLHPARELTTSRFHTMARLLLVLTICAAPWAFGAVGAWAWGILTGLVFLALVLWALGNFQRGTFRITWTPLYWPFLAFLLIAIVQWSASLTFDRIATRESALKIMTDLVIFFLAGQLLNAQPENGRALAWFGAATITMAGAISGLAMAQQITGTHAIYWAVTPPLGWIFGPYVNHNHYGGLLEMLIPISACYVLSRPSRSVARIVLWLLVGLALISVWASASRGASVAILVEGLLLGVILIRSRREVAGRGSLMFVIGAVIISAGIFLWMVQSGRTSGRGWDVFHSGQPIDVVMKDRFRGGVGALRMAKDHPWTGIGLGCFEYVFPSYADFATDRYWNHAHDDYAEVIGETGVLGGVLIVIALIMFFRYAFRGLGERLRQESGWIQVGATLGCVGLLVHSYVDFNLRIPANAAWFVVCVAIAVQPRAALGNVRKIHRPSNPGREGELVN